MLFEVIVDGGRHAAERRPFASEEHADIADVAEAENEAFRVLDLAVAVYIHDHGG